MLLSNDFQGAKSYLLEAFRTAADVGYRELIGSALEGLAAAAAQTGEFELGAILLGAAGRIGQESGVVLEPIEQEVHERATDRLLDSLGKLRFDQLANGASMSVDDVRQYIHV